MLEGDDYNNIIWTIFSVVVIASFINIYSFWTQSLSPQLELVKIFQLYFGFIGLVYASLLTEGFGRKKHYLFKKKYFNKKEPKFEHISSKGIFQFFILLPLLSLYTFSYTKLSIEISIKYLTIILMVGIIVVLIINWVNRNSWIKSLRKYLR